MYTFAKFQGKTDQILYLFQYEFKEKEKNKI